MLTAAVETKAGRPAEKAGREGCSCMIKGLGHSAAETNLSITLQALGLCGHAMVVTASKNTKPREEPTEHLRQCLSTTSSSQFSPWPTTCTGDRAAQAFPSPAGVASCCLLPVRPAPDPGSSLLNLDLRRQV